MLDPCYYAYDLIFFYRAIHSAVFTVYNIVAKHKKLILF